MPCESYGPDYTKEKLDSATRAACEMAKALGVGGLAKLSKATQIWVQRHDREDAARERKEQQIRAREELYRTAYNKLTAEEREALNIG